jgi:putative transposase
MANYNNVLEIDNHNPQMQELKWAIKNNRDKSMHVRYMVIYHHLKGQANVDIAKMFGVCAHTVGTYISKYNNYGFSSLTPAPKTGAPRLMTEEQEQKLKEVITQNTPDNVGFPNRKNWNASLALQWVYNNFGIQYSHSGMLKVLHRLNLSFTKPTYTLAKADPKKQEEFKASFEDLKKPS